MNIRGKIQNIWTNFKYPQNPIYPTEKNLDMLSMIVEQSSDESSIIMDRFCGFRVIIMTQANSQVNTRVLELLSKFKIKKRIFGVLFRTVITKINIVNSTSA